MLPRLGGGSVRYGAKIACHRDAAGAKKAVGRRMVMTRVCCLLQAAAGDVEIGISLPDLPEILSAQCPADLE